MVSRTVPKTPKKQAKSKTPKLAEKKKKDSTDNEKSKTGKHNTRKTSKNKNQSVVCLFCFFEVTAQFICVVFDMCLTG